jgi:MoxR-like ATPase
VTTTTDQHALATGVPAHAATDAVASRIAEQAPLLNRLRASVASVFLGKPQAIEFALATLLAEGHLLLEDVPGIGKTLLAKALARSLGCGFHRIQFTPDLLPSDLLGTSIYQQSTGNFVFQPGPIFTQVVLADEINRATPRTQSALLEAMSDRQVSLDGKTHVLGPPFFVLATQNPYEFEGTYPLPESQLDRFLMRLHLGYPDRAAERLILAGHRDGDPVEKLPAVLNAQEVVALQVTVRGIRFDDSLSDYLLDIVEATRDQAEILLGVSTRAALGLYRAAQAFAMLQGRAFVVPEDIKQLAVPVLAHRVLVRRARGAADGDAAEQAIASILRQVPLPG